MNITKEYILNILKEVKPKYQKEGIDILGLFGSYAKDAADEFSDIDLAYKLDYKKMSQQQNKDPFCVLLRINDIKDELQKKLKRKVDFVSNKNKKILKGIIYV